MAGPWGRPAALGLRPPAWTDCHRPRPTALPSRSTSPATLREGGATSPAGWPAGRPDTGLGHGPRRPARCGARGHGVRDVHRVAGGAGSRGRRRRRLGPPVPAGAPPRVGRESPERPPRTSRGALDDGRPLRGARHPIRRAAHPGEVGLPATRRGAPHRFRTPSAPALGGRGRPGDGHGLAPPQPRRRRARGRLGRVHRDARWRGHPTASRGSGGGSPPRHRGGSARTARRWHRRAVDWRCATSNRPSTTRCTQRPSRDHVPRWHPRLAPRSGGGGHADAGGAHREGPVRAVTEGLPRSAARTGRGAHRRGEAPVALTRRARPRSRPRPFGQGLRSRWGRLPVRTHRRAPLRRLTGICVWPATPRRCRCCARTSPWALRTCATHA